MKTQDSAQLQLEKFLPYVMNRLAETISSELSTIYSREYGLNVAQWRVLANLAQHKTLVAQEIVNFTAMEKSMISRAVNALTDRGLVTRKQAEGDNRAKTLRLTKTGAALYQSIVPNVLNWERELLSCLSTEENQNLMGLLDKLTRELQGRAEGSSATN